MTVATVTALPTRVARTPLQLIGDQITAAYQQLATGGLPRAQYERTAHRIDQLRTEQDQLIEELLDTCDRHLADCPACQADMDCTEGDALADQLQAIQPARAAAA